MGSERVKTDWTPAMDRYFVELMLDQLKKGHKMDKTFSKQAWKDMLTLFNAKFCSQYGKTFLKRRYKKLFKYYSDIRSLLERKGFSWYERQQMIVAEDAAWEKIIKVQYHLYLYASIYLFYFILAVMDVGTPRCTFIPKEDLTELSGVEFDLWQ